MGTTFTVDASTTNTLVTHAYNAPGAFRVGVKYMDNDGQWSQPYPFTITIREVRRVFYVKDHLGNIRQSINESGTVVSAQDYYPYGETLRGYISVHPYEKYRFTEKERDIETNLDYFGARYYDSQLGIWGQVDPLWEKYPGISSYAYCFDNPMKYFDPDGQEGIIRENVMTHGKIKGGFELMMRTELGKNAWNTIVNDKNMLVIVNVYDGAEKSNTLAYTRILDEHQSKLVDDNDKMVTSNGFIQVNENIEEGQRVIAVMLNGDLLHNYTPFEIARTVYHEIMSHIVMDPKNEGSAEENHQAYGEGAKEGSIRPGSPADKFRKALINAIRKNQERIRQLEKEEKTN